MTRFADIDALAAELRNQSAEKKYLLLFAYNGTGKTRLSMKFKDIGKQDGEADTLYFNAFTEDLFTWDNDLESDSTRVLQLNTDSQFFAGLEELEMDTRIRAFLDRFADFDFTIDYDNWAVSFSREIEGDESETGRDTITDIKVSRGEENIFIWCFFLAILQLAIDGAEVYAWVKHVYIDDPISSLDEHNAIAVATTLSTLLKGQDRLHAVISSHHTLFFNVLCNDLKKAKRCFLHKDSGSGEFVMQDTGDTPFFHHVASLAELVKARNDGTLYTHHFNTLRTILEKSASFHGFKKFSDCFESGDGNQDDALRSRIVNLLSHGNYSLYEPREMLEDNKQVFGEILDEFLDRYAFNPEVIRAEGDTAQ